MTQIFLLFVVLSFAIGNTFKFSFLSPDVRINFIDISVFVFTTAELLSNRARLLLAVKSLKKLLVPALLFCLVGFISLVLVGFKYGIIAQIVGAFYLFRWFEFGIVLPLALFLSPQKYAKYSLIIISFLTSLFCFAQYLIYPDIRNLAILEWDPHYYRVVGTLLDPGFTGLLLVFILIFMIHSKATITKLQSILYLIVFLLLMLTYSRSAYLSLISFIFYRSYITRSWKFLITNFLIFVLILLLLPHPGGEGVKLERTSTIAARVINWTHSIGIISKYPIMGVGYNMYRYVQKDMGWLPENSWQANHAGAGGDSSLLFVFATTGVIGLIFYCQYLYRFSKLGQIQIYILPLLVHSFFLNSLVYPYLMLWLALAFRGYTKLPALSEPDSPHGR